MSKELEADAVEALAATIASFRAISAERTLLKFEVETLAKAVQAYRLLVPAAKGNVVDKPKGLESAERVRLSEVGMAVLHVVPQEMPSLPANMESLLGSRRRVAPEDKDP